MAFYDSYNVQTIDIPEISKKSIQKLISKYGLFLTSNDEVQVAIKPKADRQLIYVNSRWAARYRKASTETIKMHHIATKHDNGLISLPPRALIKFDNYFLGRFNLLSYIPTKFSKRTKRLMFRTEPRLGYFQVDPEQEIWIDMKEKRVWTEKPPAVWANKKEITHLRKILRQLRIPLQTINTMNIETEKLEKKYTKKDQILIDLMLKPDPKIPSENIKFNTKNYFNAACAITKFVNERSFLPRIPILLTILAGSNYRGAKIKRIISTMGNINLRKLYVLDLLKYKHIAK